MHTAWFCFLAAMIAAYVVLDGFDLGVGAMHLILARDEAAEVATGQWTPWILPFTRPFFRSTGMPVWWLRPADPAAFSAPAFPCFCADITVTDEVYMDEEAPEEDKIMLRLGYAYELPLDEGGPIVEVQLRLGVRDARHRRAAAPDRRRLDRRSTLRLYRLHRALSSPCLFENVMGAVGH